VRDLANPELGSKSRRWASWFLEVADEQGRFFRAGDAIPLTQEFLGQMLGVRRTTVTIAARLLQSTRLIRYRRGLIQILIAERSSDCECFAVVTHNADKVFPAPAHSHK
jgi:Crp-like helix-turn-helix domain